MKKLQIFCLDQTYRDIHFAEKLHIFQNMFLKPIDRFSDQILVVLQSDPQDIRKLYLRFGHFLILETLWMIPVKVVIICSCVCSRPRALF